VKHLWGASAPNQIQQQVFSWNWLDAVRGG
jgi:hypothetical protein